VFSQGSAPRVSDVRAPRRSRIRDARTFPRARALGGVRGDPAPTDVPYGYENGTNDTVADLERQVIDAGERIVLDVAHLYRNDPGRFHEQFQRLTDRHGDAIAHVNLCDATAAEDHHQLGAGDIPLETVVDWLTTDYDGTLTLELIPDCQPTARDRFTEIAAQL